MQIAIITINTGNPEKTQSILSKYIQVLEAFIVTSPPNQVVAKIEAVDPTGITYFVMTYVKNMKEVYGEIDIKLIKDNGMS